MFCCPWRSRVAPVYGRNTFDVRSLQNAIERKDKGAVDCRPNVDNALPRKANGKDNSRISSKPKLHMLYHLQEDLDRFGTAMHFDTEKGEQFNKFIREHVQHTNRQCPSLDVLKLFGQQFMFRHIVDGGVVFS